MNLKKVLVSQPAPADVMKSPWKDLVGKYEVDVVFYKFFDVVGVTASEFRRTRIHLHDFTAVIMNSKHSVDHFFRMANELRETIPDSVKYFCSSEAVSLYMQNYISFRKRKMFAGNGFADIVSLIAKHPEERILFPCSTEKQTEYTKLLDKAKIKYTRAPLYQSQAKDLTQFNLKEFDMICLFSPSGVRSLLTSFPNFAADPVPVASFGASTHQALKREGIKETIVAPTRVSPSMAMALQNYIDGVQTDPTRRAASSTAGSATPRTVTRTRTVSTAKQPVRPKKQSVFASKEKYKQLMEAKKAANAAKRAARQQAKAEALRAQQAQESVADSTTSPLT